jgi:hypothetical protein
MKEKKKIVAISGIGPKKNFQLSGNGPTNNPRPRNPGIKGLSGNGFTKTVTPHLRSIVPNVQRRMAYFARESAAGTTHE